PQSRRSQTQQPNDALGDWSKKLKGFETALLSQHFDFTTFAKDLAFAGAGTYFALQIMKSLSSLGKSAEELDLPNLAALFKPIAKLAGTPLEWAARSILRAGRTASIVSSALVKAGGAEVSLMDLSVPEVVLPTAAGLSLGEGIYHLGIKSSRFDGWLASHLHDERSDVHLRKSEVRRGASNTWHVTHSPQVTVVVNAADAVHPRKIAEQMVMALQEHHSELDQKLADAWKRQAVRDERTAF
ncbi:MAG: hypothetical protein ACREQH_06035, partial [Candidatus Binatus sp.]